MGQNGGLRDRCVRFEMPGAPEACSELNALRGEVATLRRSAEAIAAPGQHEASSMIDEGIFEDISDFASHVQRSWELGGTLGFDGGAVITTSPPAVTVLGELCQQVRQARTAVEVAVKARG